MQTLRFFILIFLLMIFASCVPTKKYNELLDKEKICEEELTKFKSDAVNYQSQLMDCETNRDKLKKDVDQLINDTIQLNDDLKFVKRQYQTAVEQLDLYEKQINQLKKQGKTEASVFQSEIDAKTQEILRRQSQLEDMENDLRAKQALLAEKEKRVYELEEVINRKDKALSDIKGRIVSVLKPYESKGLSIEEREGRIYVRLEAKLLFNTASIEVENEGKDALIDLAKTLENEKDINIVVEGHTDTDALKSPIHPKNNWELSVLRATSVVDIMLKNSNMDAKTVTASGRSEFFPVDEADKSKNRRIEIIIAPDLKTLFDLISK